MTAAFRTSAVFVFVALALVVITPSPVVASFDWGLCQAVNGSFTNPVANRTVLDVGPISTGVEGVMVNLTSTSDIDIQLIDERNGKLLIGWPSGLMKSHEYEALEYEGMVLHYSGYNGIDGSVGHEYIRVEGKTTIPLKLKVYGYTPGTALVRYKSDAVQCCCKDVKGEFAQDVAKSAVTSVGEVPVGVKNLQVHLECENDVDIKLLDVSVSPAFEIVGWPKGLLKSHIAECKEYEGVKYCYSGYNGVDSKVGREYIKVEGSTNRRLLIQAFGYAAGTAKVTYSAEKPKCCGVTAPPDSDSDAEVVIEAASLSVSPGHPQRHFTERYVESKAQISHTLVARRGFPLVFKVNSKEQVAFALKHDVHLRDVFDVNHKTSLSLPVSPVKGDLLSVQLSLPDNMPVGEYELQLRNATVRGTETNVGSLSDVNLRVFVLFNAWKQGLPEYISTPSMREGFINEDFIQLYKGAPEFDPYTNTHKFTSISWNLHQFEILPLVMKQISGFSKDVRSAPYRFARRMSGTRICIGRWSGDYSDGHSPLYWSNSQQIYQQWASSGSMAKYCQCWVFSGLVTSAMRSIGLASRSVTGFRSVHDHQPYDLVVDSEKGESVWNFHVWNDVWFQNPSASIQDPSQGWNIIDQTPQELSVNENGGWEYLMGPCNLADIKSKNTGSQYDCGFAASEVMALYRGYPHYELGIFLSSFKPGCDGDATACRFSVTMDYEGPGVLLQYGETELPSPPLSRSLPANMSMSNLWTTSIAPRHAFAGSDLDLVLTPSLSVASVLENVTLDVTLEAFMVYEDGTVENLPPKDSCSCCKSSESGSRVKSRSWTKTSSQSSLSPSLPPLGLDINKAGDTSSACSCRSNSTDPTTYVTSCTSSVHKARENSCCCKQALSSVKPTANITSFLSLLEGPVVSLPTPTGANVNSSEGHELGTETLGEKLAFFTKSIPSFNVAGMNFTLRVPASAYFPHLHRSSFIRLRASVSLQGSGAGDDENAVPVNGAAGLVNDTVLFEMQEDVYLTPPLIPVRVSCKQPVVGEPFTVDVEVKNPFAFPLSGVVVTLDGPGDLDQTFNLPTLPASNTSIFTSRPLAIETTGKHHFVASVSSCQYSELEGSVSVNVVAASNNTRLSVSHVCLDAIPEAPAGTPPKCVQCLVAPTCGSDCLKCKVSNATCTECPVAVCEELVHTPNTDGHTCVTCPAVVPTCSPSCKQCRVSSKTCESCAEAYCEDERVSA